MKKFILSILILLIAVPGFAQYGQLGGGISGITFVDGNIVFGAPADSAIFEIPISAEASITITTLIGTSFKIFNTEGDSMIFNPDGFSAANSAVAGTAVFNYKSRGGHSVIIDSLSAYISVYDSPVSNVSLFRLGTSADANRFNVDEDGDVTNDGSTNSAGGFTDGTFTVDGSGNFTGVAAFTSTGAFTTPGIDDNADAIAITIDVTTEKVNFSADADVVANLTAGTITSDATVVATTTISTGANSGTSGKIFFTASDNDKGDIEITTSDLLTVNGFSGVSLIGSSGAFITLIQSPESELAILEFSGDGSGTEYFIGRVDGSDEDKLVIGQFGGAQNIQLMNDGDVRFQKQVAGFSIVNNTVISNWHGFGDDNTGSADEIGGQIEVIATATWDNGNEDAKMVLNVADGGTLNANQLVLNTDGSVSFSTAPVFASYTRHHDITAGAATLGPTAPTPTTIGTARGLGFDADNEVVNFAVEVPSEWDGVSNMTLVVCWVPTDGDAVANNETVKWDATYRSIAVGEAVDNGSATVATATFTGGVSETDKEHYMTDVTIVFNDGDQPLTAGDTIFFQFDRDVTTDDYSGAGIVMRWELEFTAIALATF